MNVSQLKQLSALRRLGAYLEIAREFENGLRDAEDKNVTMEQVAEKMGVSPKRTAEDFALLMVAKADETAFDAVQLVNALERYLSFLGNQMEAVLVADGFLGRMLLQTAGFSGPGVKPLAIFCSEEDMESAQCGIPCYSLAKMENLTRRLNVPLGIICVPHKQAQGVADLLIAAGVHGIWNWSGCNIEVPESVAVYREDDMGAELGLSE